MRLKQIVKDIKGINLNQITHSVEIEDICIDSREAKKKSLFIALKGEKSDGKDYIQDVIKKGVRGIMVNQGVKIPSSNRNVIYLKVKSTKEALRFLVKKIYCSSSRKIKAIGITGTNGKTTISYLLEAFLKKDKKECGVIGTVNHRYKEKIITAKNTTPGYLDIHKLLGEMSQKKVDYCILEVSSHALDQGRVDDIEFKTAIFTNLTNDHLDYHKTLNHYFFTKAKLFTALKPQSLSIINMDDAYGRKLKEKVVSKILTYGIKRQADIMAKDIFLGVDGSSFMIVTPQKNIFVKTQLIGLYNVYNILAAIAAALNEKVSFATIQQVLRRFRAIPGRLEKVNTETKTPIFIDYAHTPDALLNVLKALKTITARKILLVFGCGGDRDKTKRPLMGEIASLNADFSIVTSDNPRGEKPKEIIKQIVKGFKNKKYLVIENREKAICRALKLAHANAVVLIAGKGHEDYQILKDKIIPFKEKEIIKNCIHVQAK